MLVSAKWLQDYVKIPIELDELTQRLSMSGLNHEGTVAVGDDSQVDLEVTNNRPDWLGHIGVAREISVLLGESLTVKNPEPPASGAKVDEITQVKIECPDLCPRYTARVIRGVKVGPSPKWLAERLEAIKQPVINNVVDITNYVLMECGQPLHAFDLAKLKGQEIVVRRAKPSEKIEAIDHETYELTGDMCVIADSADPVAIGGVMGGATTEVTEKTVDLLIEAAAFEPLSIRTTSRALKLGSTSSYRFERSIDPAMIDWASRRACELILELCGGELAEGVVDVGDTSLDREPITLRYSQVPRVLGIEVDAAEISEILSTLGCQEVSRDVDELVVIAPSWRRDLTREIDLIEEIARVHGYENIPENTSVSMAVSTKSDDERVLYSVRRFMNAQGFDEAMTRSIVGEQDSAAFSPWTSSEPLTTLTPMVKGEAHVRRAVLPSLLNARRSNEADGNMDAELFETACVYLAETGKLPKEQRTLSVVSGRDFYALKGVIESLIREIAPNEAWSVKPLAGYDLFNGIHSCEISARGERLAVVGEISKAAAKQAKLRADATGAELNMELLLQIANPHRIFAKFSTFPTIERDINMIVDESVHWAALGECVHGAADELLEDIQYLDTYRDPTADGPNKKRLLFRVILRGANRTLTNEEADAYRDRVVKQIGDQLGGKLLG